MTIQVIDRAFSLVELVARNGALSAVELSRETGLALSTVSRILSTLTARGILERAPDRSYRIGVTLVSVASQVEPTQHLLSMARNELFELSRKAKEDVGLAILRERSAIVVDWIYGPQTTRIIEPFSRGITLNCAFRKILLAYQSEEWIDEYLRLTTLPKYTPNTKTEPKEIWQEILTIRRMGCSVSRSENMQNAASIAAPIFHPNGLIAATVFVTASLQRFDLDREQLCEIVIQTGKSISKTLGEQSKTSRS